MDTLPPWQGGGDMVKSVSLSGSTYALSPARFEAGTPAIIEAVGLAGALDYVSSLDFEKVMLNENQTMKVLKDVLSSLDDVVILGDLDLKKSLVCFNLKGLHPQDVAMILSEQNVAVRVGHHCAQPITEKYGVTSSIRASIGLYNDEEDIFKFMDALKRARKILGGNRCQKN
jgi:cysteine desulfurase/selenocysteine lyase